MRKPNTQASIRIRSTVLLPLSSIVSIMAGLAAGITLCITSLPTYAQGSRNHLPVIITTRAQLENITATGHYQLGKDIDLGDSPWTPLFRNSKNGFSGTLLDNGSVLRNLNMASNNGTSLAFIYFLGSNSRVELRFDNASISVTGSHFGTSMEGSNINHDTSIALGVVDVKGDNNQLTLRVSNSQIEAEGSGFQNIALLAVRNTGSGNQLSLLDSQAINLTTHTNGRGEHAALGVADNRGTSAHLTLARLHNIKLDTEAQYVGSAIGRVFDSQKKDTRTRILVEKASGLDIVSRYNNTDAFGNIGLIAGSFDLGSDSTESNLTARAVSGELRANNIPVSLEALLAASASTFPPPQGTLLGINSDAKSNRYALLFYPAGINCNQVHWDISLNGRKQSGCLNNTGHGHYSHTPEGWEALWVALDITPDLQVPGEQQRLPEGNTEQLVTRQTYHHSLHPDGYYDEQTQFHPNGTGPLILRSLTLTPDRLDITLGTPVAINVTRDPDGTWQHNQTHFTLLNLDSGQLQWRTLNLDSRELGPVNSLDIAGEVLTHNSDNLFSYEKSQHLIYHYRLADQVVQHYYPCPAFNPQARFVVGLKNSLIQAEPDGNGQVTLSLAQPCDQTFDPVTIPYGEDDFRLLVQADPQNSTRQQVILLPADAQQVNGKVVRIQEPEYPWNAFERTLTVSTGTGTVTFPVSAFSVSALPLVSPSATPTEAIRGNAHTSLAGSLIAAAVAVLASLFLQAL